MNQSLLYLARSVLGALLLAGVPIYAGAAQTLAAEPNQLSENAHIVLAIATSIVFVLALALAVLLWVQTRRLHDLRGSQSDASWLNRLPPVLSLERILFRVIGVGFVFLTILVASGMIFGEQVWGRALVFSHKIVFTALAWVLFGVLLIGRKFAGWRGLTAVRATIFGFSLLFLGYVGTHFVLNVLLRR